MISQKASKYLALFQALLIFALVPTARGVQNEIKRQIEFYQIAPHSLLLAGALALLPLGALYFRVLRRLYTAQASRRQLILVFSIFFLGVLQTEQEIEFFHLPLYGVLSALILRSLADKTARIAIIKTLLLGNAVSICDEILQGVHPERFFDPRDLLLNLTGCALGIVTTLPFRAVQFRSILAEPETSKSA